MPACRCSERKRPFKADLVEGSNQRPRQWVVLKRNWTRSAFNGYKIKWSKTSYLMCRVCGCHWDTTAQGIVDKLNDSEFFAEGRIEPKVEPIDDC